MKNKFCIDLIVTYEILINRDNKDLIIKAIIIINHVMGWFEKYNMKINTQ